MESKCSQSIAVSHLENSSRSHIYCHKMHVFCESYYICLQAMGSVCHFLYIILFIWALLGLGLLCLGFLKSWRAGNYSPVVGHGLTEVASVVEPRPLRHELQ